MIEMENLDYSLIFESLAKRIKLYHLSTSNKV